MPIYAANRNATTATCKAQLLYRLIPHIAICGKRPFRHPNQPCPDGSKGGNIASVKAGARIIGHGPKADHANVFGHALHFAQLARYIGQIVRPDLLCQAPHGKAKFRQGPRYHLFGGRGSQIAIDRGDRFRILAHPFNQRQRCYICHIFTHIFVSHPRPTLRRRAEEKVSSAKRNLSNFVQLPPR